jgi:hypothetical protein
MIDLNSAISFEDGAGNDFNLNTIIGAQVLTGGGVPLSGFSISGVGVGAAMPIGYEDPKATADGIDTAEAYVGRRILTLAVDVYGSSRSDMFKKVQDVTNLMRFMPKRYELTDGFRRLKARMLTTDANFPSDTDIPVYFYARPMQIPQAESSTGQFAGSDALGYSTKMILRFLLKYPFKYHQFLNEESVPIDNTEFEFSNHGGAHADAQLLLQANPTNSTQATDIKVTITLNDVPLVLDITDTIGVDGGVARSVLVDYKDQIVYKREQDTTTLVTTSSIAQNLVNINSGALFATIEPNADLGGANTIKVRIQNAGTLTDITTGYTATLSWREAWY